MDDNDNESILPVYEPPSRSLSVSATPGMGTVSTRGSRPLNGRLPLQLPSTSTLHFPRSFLQMEPQEAFTYAYNIFAGNTHVQIFILVESEPDQPNHYTVSLSMKIGLVERAICTPVTMKLSVDPRRLDFVVFVFPPRTSLPTGCLYHLRVWLRTGGVDHRMFAERELWFGRDPDFCAITDASFARLLNATQDMSIYQGIVGHAHVSFVLRWTLVEPGTYALSLDYEAGGAGKTLFANYQLRLYCDPQSITFLIYTIPVPSSPAGASHRLRVWLRTPHSHSHCHSHSHSSDSSGSSYHTAATATTDAYLYQRLWKSDDFKIGAYLAFESVHKIVLATPGWRASSGSGSDDPPTFDAPSAATVTALMLNRRVSRLEAAPNVGVGVGIDDTAEAVDDR